MDFLGHAVELETETLAAYRALSRQCASHEGVHAIMEMLIKDHEIHLKTLNKAQDQNVFELDDPGVFKEIREQLARIRADRDTFSCDIDQLRLYREARDLVRKKHALYQRARDGMKTPAGRNYLEKLILQENKQIRVLDNIIQMVERPESWLEDAEFSHLDEY